MAGYRDQDHAIPGLNLAVIDVDEGISIDTAKLLLKDYKYLIHTTKRHTNENHRFRVIFPLSHVLKLNPIFNAFAATSKPAIFGVSLRPRANETVAALPMWAKSSTFCR